MTCTEIKDDIYMHQAHPKEDFYNGLHFLFIYSLKLPLLQVSHG